MMEGRAFLIVARALAGGRTEAHRRACVGRCYYALFLECRDALRGWGIALPPHQTIHFEVKQRFLEPKDPDLNHIGTILEFLNQLRSRADYRIDRAVPFDNDREALKSLTQAADALARLDAIDRAPARRTAAISAIRARFP
jgi:uncharacterized protein (UPF0332 family)